jgi:hypothetical protein
MIAKGTIAPDKSYHYTCMQCNGRGLWHGDPCTHCYDGDMDRLMTEFAMARGERYYALLKAILVQNGRAIYDEARLIREATGRFTPVDWAVLCIMFNWPQNRMKALAEWLEETQFAATGFYDHCRDQGMKVRDMFDAARVKIVELQSTPAPSSPVGANGRDTEVIDG